MTPEQQRDFESDMKDYIEINKRTRQLLATYERILKQLILTHGVDNRLHVDTTKFDEAVNTPMILAYGGGGVELIDPREIGS